MTVWAARPHIYHTILLLSTLCCTVCYCCCRCPTTAVSSACVSVGSSVGVTLHCGHHHLLRGTVCITYPFPSTYTRVVTCSVVGLNGRTSRHEQHCLPPARPRRLHGRSHTLYSYTRRAVSLHK